MHFLLLLAFLATAHARAVNISNTWVLPEEGFPVFYRYFRDRISWYEADAVCQFHHANLVTVDTTAQYDAVRAYLRELDISSAVWVGLIRSNPEGDFTWTDYRGLSGDGYWSSAPDPRTAPLCAAANPSSDYRWEARACGGPTVASFICELPVPQWALGHEGCMVRALPALTILYLPESAAVQLTADCGLAGVKRLQCVGNVKREDLLRDLSCTEEVDLSNTINNLAINVSTTADVSTITENIENANIVTEDGQSMEHDNLFDGLISTIVPSDVITKKSSIYAAVPTPKVNIYNGEIEKNIEMNIMENNNLQSNDIPKIANSDNFLSNYRIQKMEDEDNMQHKKLHDELARLGNFETIFTQPTDHFVPPLVIAKARLNDDMTVLSLEEKQAQHFGNHKVLKHSREPNIASYIRTVTSTDQPTVGKSLENLGVTEQTATLKEDVKKEKLKNTLPKKFAINGFDIKSSNNLKSKNMKQKLNITKVITSENHSSFINSNLTDNTTVQTSTTQNNIEKEYQSDRFMDLTVTLHENEQNNLKSNTHNESKIEIKPQSTIKIENISHFVIKPQISAKTIKLNEKEDVTPKSKIFDESPKTDDNVSLNTVNQSRNLNDYLNVFEITTEMPVFKDDIINSSNTGVNIRKEVDSISETKNILSSTESTRREFVTSKEEVVSYATNLNLSTTAMYNTENVSISFNTTESTAIPLEMTTKIFTLNHLENITIDQELYAKTVPSIHDVFNTSEIIDDPGNNTGDFDIIDDYQSPLLSGANEPVQRPMRSRRPKQPPNRINKFNPFRILG